MKTKLRSIRNLSALLALVTLLLIPGLGWGQTTINFDDAAKWTAGSTALTSYATNHTYVDGVFSATGGPALRNAIAAQDGFAGALGTYSWRLTNAACNWVMTIASGGVSTFSVAIRRWDNNPSPAYTLDYSINGGSNWTNVALINNATLNNSSDWMTFNGTINSSNLNILVRLNSAGTTERIMVDNFVWTGYSGGSVPSITTQPVSSIGTTSATGNGNITSTGGVDPTTRGFCWDLAANADPDINDSKIEETGTFSTGAFTGNLTGLTAGTQYKVRAFATDTVGTGYGSVATFYTLSDEPSGHAASFNASPVSQTQIDLSFSASSTIPASGYLIIQRTSAAPTGAPVDATGYTLGNTIGDGTVAAIVTNTSATSVSINGLTAGTHYYFTLFPYNWDGTNASTYNYRTTTIVPGADATTDAANDLTTEIDGPALAAQPDPILISSLADTDAEAIRVFDMDVYDYGPDGLDTKITTLTIHSGEFDDANWTQVIQGVKLSIDGGSSFLTISSSVISAESIVISVASGDLVVPDNDVITASLYIFLKTTVTDNKTLQFEIAQTDHGFTADATGTDFAASFANPTVSNEIITDVVASKLRFVQQPTSTLVNLVMLPAVSIEALDDNNNRDLDANGTVNLNSTGTLSGTVTADLSTGYAEFGNIIHTNSGNSLLLTAYSSGLTNVESNPFSIFSALAAGDILFIGYGTDDPDKFAFISNTFIPGGTQINFTDNAYTGTALATNEGSTTWTSPAGGIAKGTVVAIQGTNVIVGGGSVGSNNMSYSTSGDQILAYQGSSASPVFITGISSTGWMSSGTTNSNTSYLPASLAINISAVSFASEEDNGYYSGPTTLANGATPSLICNAANWTRNSLIQTFPSWTFTLGDHTIINVNANAQNLTINSNETLTINPTRIMTVSGNLLIKSDATGTGSLIDNGSLVSANSSVERYTTGGWSDWNTGWHQISSPVSAQAIAAFETTGAGNDYDFYGWDEITNNWMNYKDAGFSTWNSGTNFNPGQGYLISYEQTQAGKAFTGTLNTAAITMNDLSNTGSFFYTGWHLLGNPFPSALKWNDGNWALSNVAGTAKIWHEANKSYSDIAANGIIPTAQGFMVQVSSNTNSITIPAVSKVHDATAWYKSSEAIQRIFLVATESEGNSAQESQIMINPLATEGFDFDYDSRFLSGYAPQFYSQAGVEMLSTNVLSSLPVGSPIPFGFVKNNASEFRIELKESLDGTVVFLTDKKTNTVTNLTESPVYNFTAAEGDDANRFTLNFGSVGIDDVNSSSDVSVYSNSGNIYVSLQQNSKAVVRVYSLTGQLVLQGNTNGKSLTTLNAGALPNGIYIVSVVNGEQSISRKVVVRK